MRAPDWTEDEDRLLRSGYPAHGGRWRGWGELLPGRGPNAICTRARRLGLVAARGRDERAVPAGARCGGCGHLYRERPDAPFGRCLMGAPNARTGKRPMVAAVTDASGCPDWKRR